MNSQLVTLTKWTRLAPLLFALIVGGGAACAPGGGGGSSGDAGGVAPCASATQSTNSDARPPAGAFTSDQAIAAALCVALAWHPDAVLIKLDPGTKSKGWLDGGKDVDWLLGFRSPSLTACFLGQPDLGQEGIWYHVGSSSPTIAWGGGDCGVAPQPAGCTFGIGTPVDSSVVYAAAAALFAPKANGATVSLIGWLHQSCGNVGGSPFNYVGWTVSASWPGGGAGTAYFDAKGILCSSNTPC